jgi:hypothetical protein
MTLNIKAYFATLSIKAYFAILSITTFSIKAYSATLSITTFSIMILRINAYFATLHKCLGIIDTQCNMLRFAK